MTESTDPVLQRRAGVRAELVDLAVVALVVVFFGAEIVESESAASPAAIAVTATGVLSLLWRRSYPLLVLAVAIGGRLFLIWESGSGLPMLPVVAIALYHAARHGDRRRSLVTASIAAATMAAVSAAFGDDAFLVEFLEEGAIAFLPVAVGDALRSREDRINVLIEAEASARVQAERLRIARDLHDVVAHGLSAIAIQSGVAARLIDHDRAQAKEALEAINTVGRSSLDDLRSMVGALRSTDVVATLPTPTDPDDITDVIDAARRAGLRIDVTVIERFPDDVGDAVVVATHRVLQEALMNVVRHAGSVATEVRLDHRADQLELLVRNAPGAVAEPSVASTGVGIIGMRERAESVGGRLEADATPDGGFLVQATLPYRGRPA